MFRFKLSVYKLNALEAVLGELSIQKEMRWCTFPRLASGMLSEGTSIYPFPSIKKVPDTNADDQRTSKLLIADKETSGFSQ
jgi:hypothetical protein